LSQCIFILEISSCIYHLFSSSCCFHHSNYETYTFCFTWGYFTHFVLHEDILESLEEIDLVASFRGSVSESKCRTDYSGNKYDTFCWK